MKDFRYVTVHMFLCTYIIFICVQVQVLLELCYITFPTFNFYLNRLYHHAVLLRFNAKHYFNVLSNLFDW